MIKTQKAVIVAIGSYGDFLPALYFAKQLQQKHIAVCMVGFAAFAQLAQEHGVEYHGVGSTEDYARMTALCGVLDKQAVSPQYHHFISCAKASIVPIFEYLMALAEQYHMVVFSVGYCDGALWAAEESGFPLVRLSYSPADISARFKEGKVGNAKHQYYESLMLEQKNQIRHHLGLPAKTDWYYPFTATACFYPPCLVDYGAPEDDRHEYFVLGFPDQALAFEPPQQAPLKRYDLLYTCGSVFSATMAELEIVNELCERLDLRGMFVANNLQLMVKPEDYPRLEVVRRVNFAQQLVGVKLIIHHGGIGTIKDALLSQTPQLILARAFDQFYNADMVVSMGWGKQMSLADFLVNEQGQTLTQVSNLLQQAQAIRKAIQACPLQHSGDDFARLLRWFFAPAQSPSKAFI